MNHSPDLAGRSMLEPLHPRELEILRLLRRGLSNKEIAATSGLSAETVKWYNKQLFEKLGVASRAQAVARASELGLFEEPERAPAAQEVRPSHNLPAPLTSFIGRSREVLEVEQLLRSERLVVLTGAGGSGKTRLALEVARRAVGHYADGVWLVELAPLTDPALVLSAAAAVWGLSPAAGSSLETVLKRYLSRKHLLLLLDNFEHLLPAASGIASILAGAPQVGVLATSRERLHLYGESEYVVQPLSLPDLERREPLEQLLAYDAPRLLIERARAARRGISLDEAQGKAAARICVQLDGLPLALELAAGLVKLYSFTRLAEQLPDALNVVPGPGNLPARQRTLRATIEWSYSLLNPAGRALFARLAVFRGATLEALEAVCGDCEPAALRASLASLVDKNLLVPREGEDGELRFHMLETIREYAVERLEASGEAEDLHRRHAHYFAGLAEQADAQIRGPRGAYWFAREAAERQNVRLALEQALGREASEDGLRLVSALAYFWYYDAYYVEETRRFAELAVEKSAGAPAALQAGVRTTAGRLASAFGDAAMGRRLLREAVNGYRSIGDQHQACWSLVYLSGCYIDSPAEAGLGLALCREALAYFRQLDDKHGLSQALNIMGEIVRWLGDYEGARSYYQECLRIALETGEQVRIAMQLGNLGLIGYHLNQPDYAEDMFRQGIERFLEMGNVFGVVTTLPGLAGPALLRDDPERAARLLGAAHRLLEDMGAKYQPGDQWEIDQMTAEARRRLSEPDFQAAWEAGAAMTYAHAIAYALHQGIDEPPA